MKSRKGLGAFILCICIMMTNIPSFASTDNQEYSAEITAAPDGADAIVSMTFDDGLYDTAVFLNKMFKTYDLKGSCMLITDRITESNLGDWQAIFAEGYLEPQNHTATHMPLPSDKWAEANKEKWPTVLNNNTPENYQKEIVDSKTKLEEVFDGDIVAFAPSNNTLSDGAYEVVQKTYYAVRSGSRGLQTLSPTFGTEAGDWHNLNMRAFSDVKKTDVEEKKAGLKKFVDDAVSGKGWLVTLCHSIGKTDGDATEAAAEAMFSYISEYQRAGRLRSMTFGDAVKYVRERQQSAVREFENENGLFVNVTMNAETEDGLHLDSKVFAYPLTVKAQLPSGWDAVSYSLNGETKTAESFTESGSTYAYVNVVPDSGDIMLTQAQVQTAKITAAVDALYIDGELCTDFDKNRLTLSVPLAPDSTYPKVEAVSFDEGTTVTVKKISFPGSTLITAENADGKTVYNINFYKEDGIYDFSAAESGSVVETLKIGTTQLYNLSGSEYSITADNTTANFDGAIIINRDKGHATGSIPTLSHPWYAKDKYNGQADADGNAEWYYSFRSTRDCRVYYVNAEGTFWTNRTDEWKVSDKDTMKVYGRTYSKLRYKEFSAGEVINLPNFGADSSWTDAEKKYYESSPGVYVIVQSKPEGIVSSDTLVIENGVINGYGKRTVGEIRELLNVKSGCTVSFFDSAGSASEVSDSSRAARTMYAKITDSAGGESYLTFGTADFELGEILTSCTDTSKKNTYKNGTLRASVSFADYTGDLNPVLIAALYDSDGRLKDVSFGTRSTDGTEGAVTAELKIENAEGTTAKVMLFDGMEKMKPYCDEVKLTPTD